MMKKAVLLCAAGFFFLASYGQRTAEDYYNDGMKFAQRKNYKEAILYFDMALRLKADDYFTLYNRGIAKSLMGDYNAALEDFRRVIVLQQDYVKAYVAIGNCYKRLTHYDTAANFYSTAIYLDTSNAEAYYHRAHMYEAMVMFDSAKADFDKASKKGATVDDKLEYYNKEKNRPQSHNIATLTQTATDPAYGFEQKMPIKVGTGPKGGPGNVREYLSLLRDSKKKPVKYQRIKACCLYKPSGFAGNVMMEEYQVTYTADDGSEKTSTLYFTYYEYEEPKIPVGLHTLK